MDATEDTAKPDWRKRVAWLVAIWVASVAALGVAAYALRVVMNWVGMTS